jgi:hypothetical protein
MQKYIHLEKNIINCLVVVVFPINENGMQMDRNNDMLQDNRTSFFGRIRREEELDESTFNNWKIELEKELPSFWEEMSGLYSK